jgi:adenylate kinase family enzyme
MIATIDRHEAMILLEFTKTLRQWMTIDVELDEDYFTKFIDDYIDIEKFVEIFKRMSEYKTYRLDKDYILSDTINLEIATTLIMRAASLDENVTISFRDDIWKSVKASIKVISTFSDEYIILASKEITRFDNNIKYTNTQITINIPDIVLINRVPLDISTGLFLDRTKIPWVDLYDKSAFIHNNYISICNIINKIEDQITILNSRGNK